MRKFITIDVGGTDIKYALMDENAEIIEQGDIPTPKATREDFVEAIGSIYDKYADQAEAIAMAAPGKIDAGRGYFYTSGALRYIGECDMKELLKDRCPIEFCCENDAKAAALAELWKGSMKGVQNGIVMTIGTGIGGALIIDGHLYRGTTFAAGEFSGVSTQWTELYTSKVVWARAGSTAALIGRYAQVKGMDPEELNGRIFFTNANEGEAEALSVLDEFCTSMATSLHSLQLILDVQKIAIGGGISKQDLLIDTINRKLDELYEQAIKHRTPASRPLVVRCTFGNDANMIGALYHYLYEIKG
ncbi:MAG: ROK family protein [Solobacterium sp.]|nr:ROK family protein [Solobacterium sp.]